MPRDDRARWWAGSVAEPPWLRSAAAALLLLAVSVPPALSGDPTRPGDENATAGTKAGQFELKVEGELLSDYIYRGTTLSARQPAVGASIEAAYDPLYFKVEMHSVKLPTNPASEIGLSAGIRPQIGKFMFDLGATYLYYPGEIPVGATIHTDYWEAYARVSTTPTQDVTVEASLAYSPSFSNSGAWGTNVAGGIEIDLPKHLLPDGFEWSLSGDVGHSWFGTQSASLGGFPLPDYTYWHLGVTFTYEVFSLDLSYHDTNLSKENCFVFTGDPNAVPGGTINLITNPTGLRSNWCGSAFVATLSFEYPKSKD